MTTHSPTQAVDVDQLSSFIKTELKASLKERSKGGLIKWASAAVGLGGLGIGVGETNILSNVVGNLLPTTATEKQLESFITKKEFDEQWEKLASTLVSREEFEEVVATLEASRLETPPLVDSGESRQEEPLYITALHSKLEEIQAVLNACCR